MITSLKTPVTRSATKYMGVMKKNTIDVDFSKYWTSLIYTVNEEKNSAQPSENIAINTNINGKHKRGLMCRGCPYTAMIPRISI